VLASINAMGQEVEDVLRKLTKDTGLEEAPSDSGTERKKHRSVSYTHANSARHEAYDYKVVQSKK
ncbi:unnamed protein product, partial [Symbiodinium microadriaticum]